MISSQNLRSRLVVIRHAQERGQNPERHLIHPIISLWKKAGIEVTEVFGTDDTPEADVALLHVDLSVIPPEYLKLARKYPVTLNGRVADIRKSTLSRLRLKSDSPYQGPVIVKTSLNHAGIPEEGHRPQPWKIARRLLEPLPVFKSLFASKDHYRVYASPAKVPAAAWNSPDLIVEKFRPEKHDGQYCLREWYFFGNQEMQRVELSPDPLFTKGEVVHHLDLPIPQNLRTLREELGFDYGKFDYTVVDGEAAAFDFNKTVGIADPANPDIKDMATLLAKGLEKYFNSPVSSIS